MNAVLNNPDATAQMKEEAVLAGERLKQMKARADLQERINGLMQKTPQEKYGEAIQDIYRGIQEGIITTTAQIESALGGANALKTKQEEQQIPAGVHAEVSRFGGGGANVLDSAKKPLESVDQNVKRQTAALLEVRNIFAGNKLLLGAASPF